MKKERKVQILVGLILLMALLLRIIPLLQGYPFLVGGDAKRDFVESLHILEFGSLDLADSYGAFPSLHIIESLFSMASGLEMEFVAQLFPQIVAVIGLLFFYLFLRRFFEEKIAVLALFIAAVFGPTIWWSMQAVRETIGLFAFPMVLYFFVKAMDSLQVKDYVVLYIMTIVLIISHHWSTFILLATLLALILLMYRKETQAWLHYSFFVIFALLWWSFAMPIIFRLFEKSYELIATNYISIVFMFLVLLYLLAVLIFGRSGRETKWRMKAQKFLERKRKPFLLLYTGVFILSLSLLFVLNSFLAFQYPFQQYLTILALVYFAGLGILLAETEERINLFFVLNGIFAFLILFSGVAVGGNYVSFDALRIIEYLPFFLAAFAAIAIIYLYERIKENSVVLYVLLLFLVIVGALIYPPIYLIGEQTDMESAFFDIRDYIKYTPPEGQALLEWGEDNDIYIYSQNFEHERQMNIYFFNEEINNEGYMYSVYDDYTLEAIENIQITAVSATSISYEFYPDAFLEELNLVYSNNWGQVYV